MYSKNGLISGRFYEEIYESQCCTTKKTIKKRFKMNATKQIKKFTKYQGLTMRKIAKKDQVNK